MRYKMKTLEQLGVSPAPWRINDHASVLDRYFEIISGQYGPYNWHNASLIAAAPQMYKHGVELVSSLEDWMKKYPPSEFSTFGQAYQLLVEAINNFRSALAKAAGESEVSK